jgi:uracil-DNA glycosylase
VLFERTADPSKVQFVIVSQEPGHWLRSNGDHAPEERLRSLCQGKASPKELRQANPLIKVAQIFGGFDPASSKVYWTHALKCVPVNGDRDVNKEWRKAATRCREHLIRELRLLGGDELNVIAFGKYALEMCLNVLDGQDIDQELSISEFMQSSKLPLVYKHRFKDGTVKNVNLFVFTNPSAEVVKVMKSGGKMTTEEIQDLQMKKIGEVLNSKGAR